MQRTALGISEGSALDAIACGASEKQARHICRAEKEFIVELKEMFGLESDKKVRYAIVGAGDMLRKT